MNTQGSWANTGNHQGLIAEASWRRAERNHGATRELRKIYVDTDRRGSNEDEPAWR